MKKFAKILNEVIKSNVSAWTQNIEKQLSLAMPSEIEKKLSKSNFDNAVHGADAVKIEIADGYSDGRIRLNDRITAAKAKKMAIQKWGKEEVEDMELSIIVHSAFKRGDDTYEFKAYDLQF